MSEYIQYLAELSTWDLSSKEIHQVYKLAGKFLDIDKK